MSVAAIEANQFAFLQYFGRGPGGEVQELPDATRTVSGIPHGMFNVVMGARFAPGDADERIAATLDYYRGLGLPLSWLVSPSTRPADLGARLVAHGLRHLFDDPWMALDLAALHEDQPAPPAGFAIREVEDLADLRLYDEAATRGFGQDVVLSKGFFDIYAHVGFGRDRPLRHFVGLLDGRAVAASSLCLAGGAAGIFGVATAPAARRRGIGTAMTLRPLREARALGYRLAGLQASQEGHGIYARLGFRDVCTVSWYASPTGDEGVG
ncbi:MAG TPA: GNAT family N-acetyltransferase [Thermomicrobiales bacterium]|nr:GNAT family N-acetyltransferase [Thermomicrobiales bacterium]